MFLLIGGIINLLITLLHVSLGLGLDQSLGCLSFDTRATVHILNIHVTYTCLMFAYLSLFHRKDLLSTGVGRGITAAIGLFWVLRAADQVVFYGLAAPGTLFWVVFCLLVSLLYVVPTVWNRTAIQVAPAA
jgi:hypothetical protein